MNKKLYGKNIALKGLAKTIDFMAGTYDLYRVPALEKQQVVMQKVMYQFGNKLRQKIGDAPKSHFIMRNRNLVEVAK